VAGWLAGGVVLTAGMGLVALLALYLVKGAILPLVPLTLLSILIVLLGLWIWSITESGHTPEGLLLAARLGQVGGVKRALANGVPPDVRDEMGETALMHAAAHRYPEVVKALLRHGASPGLRNVFGQTALDMARAAGHRDVEAVLEGAGMSVGPPVSPGPRPDAARGLLVVAALGGLLTAGLLRWFALPSLPPEEFLLLIDGKHLREVRHYEGEPAGFLEAELKEPKGPEAWRLGWRGARFTTEFSDITKPIELGQRLGQASIGVIEVSTGGFPPLRLQSFWGTIPILVFPLLVAFLLGRTLGAPHWFPVLARPRRPTPVSEA
jgi:hypothetical protein